MAKKTAPVTTIEASEDPAEYLLRMVMENPGAYREWRVMQVERTVVNGGAPKLKRRGQLGTHSLEALQTPGLYDTLATCYGGDSDGVPYDVQLVLANGPMGPGRRVWCNVDKRPPHLQAAQPVHMQAPYGAPQPFAHQGYPPMGAPPQGYYPPPQGYYPPWQGGPTQNAKPDNEMMMLLMTHILNQSVSQTDASKAGVQLGMEMAKEIAKGTSGQSAAGEIAEAIGNAVSSVTDSVIKAKTAQKLGSGEPLQLKSAAEIKVDDKEMLGWMLNESITAKWPAKITLKQLVSMIGEEQVDKVIKDPNLLMPLVQDAASGYKPLMKTIDDVDAVGEWIDGLLSELSKGKS